MNKKEKTSAKNRKNQHFLLLFSIGVIIMSFVTIAVFYTLYQVSKNNLISMWNNNAIEISKNVEFYLSAPGDAVLFTANKIEEMQKKGISNEEINKYLVEETAVYSTLIPSNSTGVYAYCNGEYLDGSAWVPPADYNPLERPWYIAAKEADGEIAFVKPFLNLQTNTMMMSVSLLLEDKESVVSMDIFLDSIQNLEEKMAADNDVDAAMVIDKSGVVVSHSNPDEVGINYLTDGNETQKELTNTIFSIEKGIFTINSRYGRDLVFCDHINNEWYSVLILNERDVFGSIRYIYILSSVVLIIVFLIFFGIFYIFYHKQKEVDELHEDIDAIADIYTSMDLLDFHNNRARSLRTSLFNEHFLGNNKDSKIRNADETLVSMLAAESSRNMLLQFMDIDSVKKRLTSMDSISHEYLDNDNKWNRMENIVVAREADGTPAKIITSIQCIDADKRQQESFKKMAETDSLTHILNRGGGETRIYEYMEAGRNGMFLLLDADNFKYINDTYGHDKGDEIIIILADCLTTTFRDTDVVYRLGGDEFAVFALGVESQDTAKLVLSRLFTSINHIHLNEIGDWKLHISVGAMLYNSKESFNYSTIYKKIDAAMYESKKHPGNYYTLI